MSQTISLADGSKLSVPIHRNDGVKMLCAEDRLSRLPLSRGLDPKQFTICALDAANALPQDTHPGTIVRAVFNAACIGVLLGPHPGHAFLVALWNSRTNRRECNLWMGYKGYIDLAYDSNWLESLTTRVVLRGEEFEHIVDGSPRIRHKLPIERDPQWQNVIGAYCLWMPRGGREWVPEVVGRKDLETLYKRAQKKGNTPWQTDPIPMCRKTPIIRASKVWKLTREMGFALELERQAEAGETQRLVDPTLEPQDEDESAPPLNADWTQQPLADDPAEDERLRKQRES